jgi:hypothetical protein
MSDKFTLTLAAVMCVGVVGILVGSLLTQWQIYTKCLESGQTVQMCKEITT